MTVIRNKGVYALVCFTVMLLSMNELATHAVTRSLLLTIVAGAAILAFVGMSIAQLRKPR